jgi:hypothetical protein
VRSTVPLEVKVEISVAWVVGCTVGSRNKRGSYMLGISSVEKVGLKGKWGAKKGAKPLDFIGFYWTLLDKQNPSIGLWSQLREVVGGDGGELNSPSKQTNRRMYYRFSRCSV